MGADNRLVIGGDFNASIGRNSQRQMICGRYRNLFKPAFIVVGVHAQTLSSIMNISSIVNNLSLAVVTTT